jgi:hypothetical protein
VSVPDALARLAALAEDMKAGKEIAIDPAHERLVDEVIASKERCRNEDPEVWAKRLAAEFFE